MGHEHTERAALRNSTVRSEKSDHTLHGPLRQHADCWSAKLGTILQVVIELKSTCNGHTYCLQLKNVLHIPTNWNSLLILGCLDDTVAVILVKMGYLPWSLQMIKSLQKGLKGANNLYRMQVKWEKCPQICQMICHQLGNYLYNMTT